ncbi:hypothetical protein PseudUWO311_22135 [Pseudanabaena sp. UWO311]|uniref:hypothetical protein n=1 Tax=Pseudanabaena sp. UWO311 TaxID=2487337 RepID=UPI001157041A|nr:hypothetical protein [Pseudanabaena sp. UWO311]TYQ23612.1 hypothetical protein PseudUWO311_22135 [Pseudanabaena sp. UWO311]
MEHSKLQSPNHLMTIELSSELYTALLKQVKTTGKTETELVVEGLRQILSQPDGKNTEKDRLAILEANLEKKLKQYVDSLIKDRQSNVAANPEISDRKSLERVLPIPTIRPLQVGDRVLILEPDSPYYMAKLLVIRTSLIRATVDTDTGEKTFLKRDLRFVESSSEK